MAKDLYHNIVKEALIKDGWTVTHDPFPLLVENERKRANYRTMEKVKKYRQIIQQSLSEYARTRKPAQSDAVQHQLLFDEQHDHYQLFCVGWLNLKRIYFPVFHLDIQNEKIWVQEDATDYDIVGVLEEQGVPKEDIVLAFYAPYRRPYTGYAVA